MSSPRSRAAGLALLLLAGPFAGAPAVAGETIHVQISKLVFQPGEITAHVGDTVEWSNEDFVAHTATATAGPQTAGGGWEVMIAVGKTAQRPLTRAGIMDYFCRFHPNMKGRITVLEK